MNLRYIYNVFVISFFVFANIFYINIVVNLYIV